MVIMVTITATSEKLFPVITTSYRTTVNGSLPGHYYQLQDNSQWRTVKGVEQFH